MGFGRLQEKVAFITGGGSGIGRAIAKGFAEEGATVVLAARDRANLQSAVDEITSVGGRALPVPMDISAEHEVVDAFAVATDALGNIDILVNNAGIAGPVAPVWELELEAWNQVIAVDLTGSMLCAREALRRWVPAGKAGVIINIGAEGGRTGDGRSGLPNRAPYCCAKMGLIGLTETLARESGPYGIRVNCLSAAAVNNGRWDRIAQARSEATGISDEDVVSNELKRYSLGRITEEHELSQTAIFLASDESSAITGQTLPVNCGQHMWG